MTSNLISPFCIKIKERRRKKKKKIPNPRREIFWKWQCIKRAVNLITCNVFQRKIMK